MTVQVHHFLGPDCHPTNIQADTQDAHDGGSNKLYYELLC
jgi:hypothetical protein